MSSHSAKPVEGRPGTRMLAGRGPGVTSMLIQRSARSWPPRRTTSRGCCASASTRGRCRRRPPLPLLALRQEPGDLRLRRRVRARAGRRVPPHLQSGTQGARAAAQVPQARGRRVAGTSRMNVEILSIGSELIGRPNRGHQRRVSLRARHTAGTRRNPPHRRGRRARGHPGGHPRNLAAGRRGRRHAAASVDARRPDARMLRPGNGRQGTRGRCRQRPPHPRTLRRARRRPFPLQFRPGEFPRRRRGDPEPDRHGRRVRGAARAMSFSACPECRPK